MVPGRRETNVVSPTITAASCWGALSRLLCPEGEPSGAQPSSGIEETKLEVKGGPGRLEFRCKYWRVESIAEKESARDPQAATGKSSAC